MDNKISYSSIKDSVVYGFDEYINQDNFTPPQAAAKIIEEDWRELNYNTFTKTCYFINIAIESFKLGQIADFIYDRIEDCISIQNFNEMDTDDLLKLKTDVDDCKKRKKHDVYKIIETSFGIKSRIDYLLSLKD